MMMPPAFSAKDTIHAIIETPRGSRNKFNFKKEFGLFELKKSLPVGLSFPLDFGFIPHTRAEDGDPVDVLVFMEEPGFPGCLVECRVIGVIIAEQEKKKELIRNDRILAVSLESAAYADYESPSDISDAFMDDITRFFETYHEKEGTKFKVIKVADAEKAIKLIKENLIL